MRKGLERRQSTSPIRVIKFSEAEPLDRSRVTQIGNEKFANLFSKFLREELKKLLERIGSNLDSGVFYNHALTKNLIHKLKISASYVGASKVHFDCYHMLEQMGNGSDQAKPKLYQRLLENCLHFHEFALESLFYKSESANLIHKYDIPKVNIDGFPISQDYKLVQNPSYKNTVESSSKLVPYFCLAKG